MKRYTSTAAVFLLSLISLLALTVDLDIPMEECSNLSITMTLFLRSFSGFSIAKLILFFGLYSMYAHMLPMLRKCIWEKRSIICVGIPAAFFSMFMVLGYSFQEKNSWELLTFNGQQTAKSLVAFIGYCVFFSIAIAWLYVKASKIKLFESGAVVQNDMGRSFFARAGQSFERQLGSHPFRTTFMILLAVYLPLSVLHYPGVIQGDGVAFIPQGFNAPEWTSDYLNLIDENIRLNGHHPIVYTLFVHLCLVAGNAVFGSYNAGLFLVSIVQCAALLATVSSAVEFLVKRGMRLGVAEALIVYFAVAPGIQRYAFVVTKDTFTAYAMLWYIMCVLRILMDCGNKKTNVLYCALAGIAVALLRNEGKYVILFSLVVTMLLDKAHRRSFGTAALAVLTVAVCFFNILMPSFSITPTSRREALSVPFQQTARYVWKHGGEVTELEKAAIEKVLDYNSIQSQYNPVQSDIVKATFKENAEPEDLAEYFKVWFGMGLKHPGTYIQATINNYYYYFFPGKELGVLYGFDGSEGCMSRINSIPEMKELGIDFHYPKALERPQRIFDQYLESIFRLPLLSMLRCTALYVWSLLLLIFYLLQTRRKKEFCLVMPLLLILCTCLLGPCNGNYFRYIYGIYFCLPFVILFIKIMGEKGKGESQKEERTHEKDRSSDTLLQ